MSIKTTHFRDMAQKSEDIFEATIVIGKRARQIITERIARNEIRTFDRDTEFVDAEDLEVLEPDINYVEKIKATTEALGEFLDGELEWTYDNKEGEKSAEE